MVLVALCFPVLVCAFLLAMERFEAMLLPIRTPVVPHGVTAEPEGPPVAVDVPAPRPPSSEQDPDAVAA